MHGILALLHVSAPLCHPQGVRAQNLKLTNYISASFKCMSDGRAYF
jgi:hypothetical protein